MFEMKTNGRKVLRKMAMVNVWGAKVNQNKNGSNVIDVYTGATPARNGFTGIGGTFGKTETVQEPVQDTNTVANKTTNKNSIYSRSMELMKKAAQMQMNNQLNTLKASAQQLLNSYQTSQNALNQQLDADINANEVERYKAQNALREALANRGALDSGVGRQEALNMSNAYSNRQNPIQQAYNSNLNELKNNANTALADLDLAYNQSVSDTNSNILQTLSDLYAKGYKTSKDYTVQTGDAWNTTLAELRKHYGL